jgi:hypothetical protein
MGRKAGDLYKMFIERYIPCVIGKIKFRMNCYANSLSEYCSVSDEAMAFLVYYNNYDVWVYKLLGDENATMPSQRFFESTKGRGHTYNQDGRKYYNRIFEMIKNDRKERGKQFDQEFLKYMNDTLANVRDNRKGKRKRLVNAEPLVKCFVEDDEENEVPMSIRLQFNVGQVRGV